MDETARARLEQDIRERCDRADHGGAATALIKGYGPEILGFLVALHKDHEDAGDVFSLFSENVWKGLPGFAWESSVRTWAYTIARNTSYRYRRTNRRREAGQVALSAAGEVAQKVRTATLTFLKTAQKDRFAALRETLPEEDQMLLILRVDRGLAWDELARIMAVETQEGEGGALDAATLKTESARLRKRFQLVKEKLLTMGKRAGLVPTDE